jgi:hypothetical protein
MAQVKVRDCDFEVDYIFTELQAVDSWMENLDDIAKRAKPDVSKVLADAQLLLGNMERRLLHSYKIPLSEETRKAFHAAQEPVPSTDEFLNNTLPGIAHALLFDMLNNYCSCKAGRAI